MGIASSKMRSAHRSVPAPRPRWLTSSSSAPAAPASEAQAAARVAGGVPDVANAPLIHSTPSSAFSTTTTTSSPSLDKKGPQKEDPKSLAWLDFEDGESAFRNRTNDELLRAWAVFKLCSYPWLVRRARPLIAASDAVLGKRLTSFILRSTFFAHFCAGESQEELLPVLDRLREAGVGAILDYAAEADVPAAPKGQQQQGNQHTQPSTTTPPGPPSPAQFFKVSDDTTSCGAS